MKVSSVGFFRDGEAYQNSPDHKQIENGSMVETSKNSFEKASVTSRDRTFILRCLIEISPFMQQFTLALQFANTHLN